MGVVEPEMGGAAWSAREFIHSIREMTCQAGADAVLAEVNGRGMYVRGTLIKFRADGRAAPPPGGTGTPVPPPPPSAVPSPP